VDIGELALDYARNIRPDGIGSRLLHRLANQPGAWQSDLVSFLCFDGGFAEALVKLGRESAVAREKEVREFFLT
jgi:NTE family protein